MQQLSSKFVYLFGYWVICRLGYFSEVGNVSDKDKNAYYPLLGAYGG